MLASVFQSPSGHTIHTAHTRTHFLQYLFWCDSLLSLLCPYVPFWSVIYTTLLFLSFSNRNLCIAILLCYSHLVLHIL